MTDTEGKERTVQGEGWDRGRGWDWERMSNVSLKLKTGTTGCQNFPEMKTGAPLGRGRRRRFFFSQHGQKKRRANIFPTARFCFFNGGFEVRGRKRKSCWGVHGHPEPARGAIGRIFSDFPDFPEKYFLKKDFGRFYLPNPRPEPASLPKPIDFY